MATLEQARSHFEAGQFGQARVAALEGLNATPDDVELLRVAGRAGVETGADDAVEQLAKVTELQPDSAEAWRDLGDALAAEGRTDEAGDAFRKVVEIEPDDEVAITALGHAAYQAGDRSGAVTMLEQVADRGSMTTAAISLVDMYRALGQGQEALQAAQRVAAADPEDPLYALDVAELALEVGNADEAVEAFGRLRQLVDLPEHEVAALQGLVKAELARDRAAGGARAGAPGERDRHGRPQHRRAGAPRGGPGRRLLAGGRRRARAVHGVPAGAWRRPRRAQEAEELIDATLADLRRSLGGEDRG